jgi:hypothetical protein
MKRMVNSWRCILNERLRVLKLLEDGKINAEEAARLLEALSHTESREKKRKHKVWSSLETIPDVIASAITTSFKHPGVKETIEFPKKKKIDFRGISGDLMINGMTQDVIEVEKDGLAKMKEKNNALEIKALSGKTTINAPITTDFGIKGISGSIRISHIAGSIEIESVSGETIGTELSGSFTGNFISGDVDLDYHKTEKVSIRSKTGNVILRLDTKIEAEIDLETEQGTISCDFALEDEEKKTHRLTGIINKPKAKIEIKSSYGDIAIKKRPPG